MSVIVIPPTSSRHNDTEIAICQTLSTREETLKCLQDLQAREDFATTCALCLIVALVVGLVLWPLFSD